MIIKNLEEMQQVRNMKQYGANLFFQYFVFKFSLGDEKVFPSYFQQIHIKEAHISQFL